MSRVATQYIRRQLCSDILIIALTASATPEELERALVSGMNRHLQSPSSRMNWRRPSPTFWGWQVLRETFQVKTWKV